MLGINHSEAIVTLDHALGGLHLRALVVGDVALDGLAGLARLVIEMPAHDSMKIDLSISV
jgi:hypothetical protein